MARRSYKYASASQNDEIRTDGCDAKVLPYYTIFQYAEWTELAATFMGVIAGVLSGAGVCFNMIVFGELSTAFVERTTSIEGTTTRLPLTAIFGGGRILTNATYEENMVALMEDGIAVGLAMLISVILATALCTISMLLVNWSAFRQIKRIRHLFLEGVLRQDMTWYDTDKSFNLASRMSEDMLKLKDGLGEKISIVSHLVGTAFFCIVLAFPLGWKLALACVAIVPFSVTSSVILSNYQTRSSAKEMESYSQAGKHAEEVLKSVRTVVAFAGEDQEIQRYKVLLRPAESSGRRRGILSGLGNGFNWVLTYSLNAIGLAYGARLVLMDAELPTDDRTYVVGNVFAIMSCIYMAIQSITFSVPHIDAFSGARAAASGIFPLLKRIPDVDSLSPLGMQPRRLRGEISLHNVHFSYPARPDVEVLKGFSLNIESGHTVALVGSSGCGKSTILQLVQRMYDPISGEVKIDNNDLRSLNLGWLRSSIGVVGQEPVLFRGTIYENITIGMPEATLQEVTKAADIAFAHQFITQLPNGYDTMIGERGASLSGGQKQRIAIARALLRNPAVLLLDEATSALDPHSEAQVQAALDRAASGRTTLVVTHRLSTIYNANLIVCMDQGEIVEQGTHKELMERKGFYWNLVATNKDNKDNRMNPDICNNVIENGNSDIVKNGQAPILDPNANVTQKYKFEIEDGNSNNEQETTRVGMLDIMKQNAPEWPLILVGSIAAIVQGACFPGFAMLFGNAVSVFAMKNSDEVTSRADIYSGLFILVSAIAGVSMFVQSAAFTSAGLKLTTRLRLKYFGSLLRQDMGYYDHAKNAIGALCARLTGDAAAVQGGTGVLIGLILQGFSSLIVGFLMGIVHNWKLTLVAVAFVPITIGSMWLEGIVSNKSQKKEKAAMEDAAAVATEAISGIRTVQSLGIEKVFLEKFDASCQEAIEELMRSTKWRGLVFGLGIYIPFLSFCAAIIYGVSLIAYEGVHFKTILLVTQATMYGAYMLGHALVCAPGFTAAKNCGARILATINRTPAVVTEDGIKDNPYWSDTATGQFHMKNIQFSYPTRPFHKVLNGIDLRVEAGKTVALVGPSGCGKSTVLQLLQRFYDPQSGNIELDGLDTRYGLTLPRLRRQLGVVQQEPVLFDRSLAENIAYGDTTRKVPLEEIIAAAKAANIHTFIASLPQGYDTSLGSSGAQLSGGQKQRVCIARALVRSPRLLLLDEATSALDANSEKVVAEALEAAAKGRTCITIAHRLSTIKNADLICVFDKGQIVERGTHNDLMKLQGRYYKLSLGEEI